MSDIVSRGDKAINIRYRPAKLSEVIGMESYKEALSKWVEMGERRTKTLLFHGSLGSGKTTLARILAMGLNCEKGDTSEPCLECPSCKAAMEEQAMHISEYNMIAANKKDDAEEIVKSMYKSCFTGRNRIFILDEAHGMSSAAQNLLLKIAESPPPNTYIIICTTEPQKIIKTLRSRCESYEIRVPTYEDIKTLLAIVVKQEMPEMKREQRVEILEACKGLSYREILMKLEKYIKGGGTGGIAEAFQSDYFLFAKIVMTGDFLSVIEYIAKGEDDFDVEAGRRVLRTFISNQIVYAMKEGKTDYATRCSNAFSHIDKGFYTDPNPLPSFKTDLFRVCLCLGLN